MKKSNERVTMKSIAEEAGVTLTTVSRILNQKGDKYAPATKDKIFAIAKRLKYRPNALVLGMQSGITHTAGVMIPTDSQFYAQLVAGIHARFHENDTIMLLSWNPAFKTDKDDQQERHIIHQLLDRRVDGIILRPGNEHCERSYFEEIWDRGVPFITVDREMAETVTDFVGTDDLVVGHEAAKHLLGLGHQRVLFLGDSPEVSTSQRREDGFRKVFSEAPHASCQCLNFDNGDGEVALLEILRSKERPTAIFAYNDPIAEHAGNMILQEGLKVPDDISLMGCGNQPTGTFPFLITTFDQQPFLVGRAAAELYLERVDKKSTTSVRRELIPAKLIQRSSTAAPHK
ncbi:MAG: LacI family transcriptional regulator [Candidatus Promineifilaceae bacterium]